VLAEREHRVADARALQVLDELARERELEAPVALRRRESLSLLCESKVGLLTRSLTTRRSWLRTMYGLSCSLLCLPDASRSSIWRASSAQSASTCVPAEQRIPFTKPTHWKPDGECAAMSSARTVVPSSPSSRSYAHGRAALSAPSSRFA
jgi:hypothetical protein